jgi:hypothetical protein
MTPNYTKPIFDHTHYPKDKWMVQQVIEMQTQQTQYFCLKCAGICQLVPIHILPPWIREGKRKGPKIDMKFRNSGDELPLC